MWFKSPCAQNTFKNTSPRKAHIFTMIAKNQQNMMWVSDQTCWFAPTVTHLHRQTSVRIPTPLAPLAAAALKASHPKLPDRTETISVTWRLAEAEPQEAAAEILSDQKHSRPLWPQQPHPVPHQIIHKIIFDFLVLPCVQSKPNLFLVQLPRIRGVASNWKAVTARHPKIDRIP